jgi:hypothetical protein
MNDILDATIQPRNGGINRPAIAFGPVVPSGGGKGETVRKWSFEAGHRLAP